ncbi:MAG: hypothetical protein JSW52_02475 [Candidatus Coatesbacteria bacterium]|nr:MAG: hypothetical protein JSW52_02475 [Candidatus Coatesbacteria bacterium]
MKVEVPRGIEVLVKKAAVDPDFKTELMERRSGAADIIGLELNGAEAAMLDGIPAEQLSAFIANTKVAPRLRPVFRGYAAAAMLAALGVAVAGCIPAATGSRPDEPGPTEPIEKDTGDDATGSQATAQQTDVGWDVETGIRPDIPEEGD